MNRRSFLSLCGLAAGSCLIPDVVARVIRDTCVLANQPYLVTPPKPFMILSAVSMYGMEYPYTLLDGDARHPPTPLTWLEYGEQFDGLDIKSPKAIREFFEEHFGGVENPAKAWKEYRNQPITGSALSRWEDWWEHNESPGVLAHQYLRRLPLDDGQGAPRHQPLGQLSFTEGERHAAWYNYVEAPDLATLACLQNRLNELNQGVAIRIEAW